jgi:RNA polymerase sigma-70 factor (ECF subfamily)
MRDKRPTLESAEQPAIQPPAVLTRGVDDGELVAAVLRKDRKATAEFVNLYAGPIYRYLSSRLSPRTDLVDDLVQEVFLAAWKSLNEYRGESPLRAWLLGIARHKVEDHYRSMLHQAVSLDGVELEIAPHTSDGELETLLDLGRLREKTHRVLAELPDAYRTALLWRYWEKTPSREMGAKIGRTEKAVERLLARARAMFRERWNDE